MQFNKLLAFKLLTLAVLMLCICSVMLQPNLKLNLLKALLSNSSSIVTRPIVSHNNSYNSNRTDANNTTRSSTASVINKVNATQQPVMTDEQLFGQLTPVSGQPSFRFRPPENLKNSSKCTKPPGRSVAKLLDDGAKVGRDFAKTLPGGFWWPKTCWPPLSFTAVLVPYRNRSQNLKMLLPHLQAVLQQQNIAFGLFVIEQMDNKLFNRAALLNIGFKTALRFHKFDCFVFQDADKLPEFTGNTYDCDRSPKLLIGQMRAQKGNKYNKGQLYNNFFGGVTAIDRQTFESINGNANGYYGWGREDDELSARLRLKGKRIHYVKDKQANYVNLGHANDIVGNKMPWPFPHLVKQKMVKDGLSSLNFTSQGLFLADLCVLVRVRV